MFVGERCPVTSDCSLVPGELCPVSGAWRAVSGASKNSLRQTPTENFLVRIPQPFVRTGT